MGDTRSCAGQILRAEAEDAPRIRELMEQSVARLQSRDWFVDDDIPFILRHIEDEGYILKYVCGDVLAGYLMVRRPGASPDNLGKHLGLAAEELGLVTHMESTSVDPAFRGQGIFRSLLSAAVERERSGAGTRYLMATVHPENRYSKNVLSDAGFEPVMTIEKYGSWVRTVMYMDLKKSACKTKGK